MLAQKELLNNMYLVQCDKL